MKKNGPQTSDTPVRLKDIALKANVHYSTVSLAVRGSPVLSEETRTRIQKIAEEMGYRPNPTLGAFNRQRTLRNPISRVPSIAFITSDSGNLHPPSQAARKIHDGIKTECLNSGIGFECFKVGPNALSFSRLDHILISRGINAVVLHFENLPAEAPSLTWERYSCAKIESMQTLARLDSLCPNHRRATRFAVRRLARANCRHIGFAMDLQTCQRQDHHAYLGYLIETESNPDLSTLPKLSWDATDDIESVQQRLSHWITENRIDALISPHNRLLDHVGSAYPKIATISTDSSKRGSSTGVDLRYFEIGKDVVQHLLSLVQTNTRGLSNLPSQKLCSVQNAFV